MQKKNKIEGRFWLRKDQRPNKEGRYPIYIDYSIGTTHARASTKVRVKESEWNAISQEIVSSDEEINKMNLRLQMLKQAIDYRIKIGLDENDKEASIDFIRKVLDKYADKSFHYNIKETNDKLREKYVKEASLFYIDKMLELTPDKNLQKLKGEIHGIPTPKHLMYKIGSIDFAKYDDYKGMHYHFLIEYNINNPSVGIYYGCKCLWDLGSDLDPEYVINKADYDWAFIKDEACRILNTVFIDIDFTHRFKVTDNANDNTYWPFWITLNRDEDIKEVGLQALKIIKWTYERYMNNPDSFKPRKKESNKQIRTRFTEEAYEQLRNKIDGIDSDENVSSDQRIKSILFNNFIKKAVEQGCLQLDYRFCYDDGKEKSHAYIVNIATWMGKKDNKVTETKDLLSYMLRSLFVLIKEKEKELKGSVIIPERIKSKDKKWQIPWTQLSYIFLTKNGATWSAEELRRKIWRKEKEEGEELPENYNIFVQKINGLMKWFNEEKEQEILRNKTLFQNL